MQDNRRKILILSPFPCKLSDASLKQLIKFVKSNTQQEYTDIDDTGIHYRITLKVRQYGTTSVINEKFEEELIDRNDKINTFKRKFDSRNKNTIDRRIIHCIDTENPQRLSELKDMISGLKHKDVLILSSHGAGSPSYGRYLTNYTYTLTSRLLADMLQQLGLSKQSTPRIILTACNTAVSANVKTRGIPRDIPFIKDLADELKMIGYSDLRIAGPAGNYMPVADSVVTNDKKMRMYRTPVKSPIHGRGIIDMINVNTTKKTTPPKDKMVSMIALSLDLCDQSFDHDDLEENIESARCDLSERFKLEKSEHS